MIHSCVFISLVIVVHESLVCPEQLNCLLFFRKILQFPQILWFSSILVYLNSFQQWLYDVEIHVLHTEDNWETRIQLLQKIQTLTDAPEEKTCIKSLKRKLLNRMKMCICFLFCLNIIFFIIFLLPSEATEDSYMFSRRLIKLNLPWSSNSKSFHFDKLWLHKLRGGSSCTPDRICWGNHLC